jgi:hypothetical protein
VEEGAGAGLEGVKSKSALIPDGGLRRGRGGALGVPVAGNLEGGCGGEVVVVGLAVGVIRGVHEEAVAAKLLMEGEEAGGVGVDDGLPIAVEGGGGAVIDVDEEGGGGLGLDEAGGKKEEGREEVANDSDLRHGRGSERLVRQKRLVWLTLLRCG